MIYDRFTKKEIAITSFLGCDLGMSTGDYMGICEYDSWERTSMVSCSNESSNCNTSKLCYNNNYQEKEGDK